MFADARPVYETDDVSGFKNALYFHVLFKDDCAICLSYHYSPLILECNHVFCANCLKGLIYKECPICFSYINGYKEARFFFKEEIKSHILLRKISTKMFGKSFEEFAYAAVYYKKMSKKLPFYEFYQSADGQMVFLDKNQYKTIKEKPEYIYARIYGRYKALKYFPHLSNIEVSVVFLKLPI